MIDVRIILFCTALFIGLSSEQADAEDSCSVDLSFVEQFDQLSQELIGTETALPAPEGSPGASVFTYRNDNEQVILADERFFRHLGQTQIRINLSNNAFVGVEVRVLTYNDIFAGDDFDAYKIVTDSASFYKCTGGDQWNFLTKNFDSSEHYVLPYLSDPQHWQEEFNWILEHISELPAP